MKTKIRNHERIHSRAIALLMEGYAFDARDAFTIACGLAGVSAKRRIIPRLP